MAEARSLRDNFVHQTVIDVYFNEYENSRGKEKLHINTSIGSKILDVFLEEFRNNYLMDLLYLEKIVVERFLSVDT